MAQSIAQPQGMNQGRIFFGTDPSPHERGPKSKFHTFSYEKKILLVFEKGYESDVGPGVFHIVNKVENDLKTHTFWTLLTMWNTLFMGCTPVYSQIGENTLASHPVTASFIFI
jgi:hypothetical protein